MFNHLNFLCHTFDIFKIWMHLNRPCWQTLPNNPQIRFMLSFMVKTIGQVRQIGYFSLLEKNFRKPKMPSLHYCVEHKMDDSSRWKLHALPRQITLDRCTFHMLVILFQIAIVLLILNSFFVMATFSVLFSILRNRPLDREGV